MVSQKEKKDEISKDDGQCIVVFNGPPEMGVFLTIEYGENTNLFR